MSARFLLDTHTFIWLASDDARLSTRARAVFEDASLECFLSAASVWEMGIKASLGKLTLRIPLEQLVDGGIARGLRPLAVAYEHAYLLERLPFHHRDPFDRLIAAQAMREQMQLVSADEIFDRYGVTRVWT